MASRRLDISSLLCDDSQPAFSPLEALVQAATEERNRLNAVEEPFHRPQPQHLPHPRSSPPERHPVDDQHIVRSPVSPHLTRHTYVDDQRIQPQQSYLPRQAPHHDHLVPQEKLQHQQRVQDLEHRAYEVDRRRRIQEAELQQRLEEQQRIELEYQRQQHELRAQELERLQREEEHQRVLEYDRQRREERREAERLQLQAERQQQQQREYQQRLREEQLRELERQRALELQREEQQRQLQRAREIERQRELDRQRELLERQQREAAERHREMERQRELERIQELQRRQFLQQDIHEPQQRFHDPLNPPPIATSPHTPSISHLISHPSHRNSDPQQIKHSTSPISPDLPPTSIPTTQAQDGPRPVKKRRYSQSPTRPIPDDKERIVREREKMVVGELGYGRVDTPVAGPSSASRRPGSGHGQGRKSVAVSDLLVDKDRPSIPPRPDSHDREAHRVLSPLGRRSPPGSQTGRAKAARKSDEHLSREPPPPKEPVHAAVELDVKKPKEEPKIKHELNPSRSRTTSDESRPALVEEPRPKKGIKDPAPPPSKILPAPIKARPDDAHEWFLHQYDEEPSPTTSSLPDPPPSHSPSVSPVTSTLSVSATKSPAITHKALTPITAAVALEQELEELVSNPTTTTVPITMTTMSNTIVKRQEPDDMDLDLDLAVEELVETLENDDVKHVDMEVDVEDELLSLVDDHPPLSSSNSGRRSSGPSSTSTSTSSSHAHASTSSSHAVVSTNAKQQAPPLLRSVGEASHPSPPTISASLAPFAGLSAISAVRHSSTRPTSERGSMPPPALTSMGGVAKKGAERAGSVVPSATGTASSNAKKKKVTTAKAAKAKSATMAATAASSASVTSAPAASTASKPRAKPTAKGKRSAVETISASASSTTTSISSKPIKAPGGKKAAAASSVSRSRSTSVMPAGSVSIGPESDAVKAEKQEEEEDSDAPNEDDKLYCVCKTKYDEDRCMIACDRCDEWYHTQCVNMPDLEVDLVDQFICPPCVEKNPHLNLRTTYKQRCLYGLRHPDPSSPKACHKAARGAFSKYCSDECGVKYMQSRIDTWAKKGGKTEKLWESVKHAEKREGVVVCAAEPETNGCTKMEVDVTQDTDVQPAKQRIVQPTKTKVEREMERLNGLLDSVVKLREEIKRGMEVIVWRERLLQLASERAEQVGQCGWDQRLCFDDEEWADIGAGVLESYDEGVKEENADGEMEVDGAEDQWWCPGNKVCDRHAGWQTVRFKDVCKEKEKKEEALAKLTTREREIRKRIEDMLDPQNSTGPANNKDTISHAPLKSSNAKIVVNGHPKSKGATTTGEKKGKKRKAPTS